MVVAMRTSQSWSKGGNGSIARVLAVVVSADFLAFRRPLMVWARRLSDEKIVLETTLEITSAWMFTAC